MIWVYIILGLIVAFALLGVANLVMKIIKKRKEKK